MFDHLIIIFDQVTGSKFEAFGLNDFMQVERAKRLELKSVVDSIKTLNNQVNAVKNYHSKFKKVAENDRLGFILDESMPEFLRSAENLLHVSQFQNVLELVFGF